MVLALTTANKVVKEVQYAPHPVGASATFVNIGDTEDFNISRLINTVKPGKLGIETKYKIMRVGNRYRVAIKYFPTDTVFMSKCVNLVSDDATNNRDQPLHYLMSQMMDDGAGTLEERFLQVAGGLCNSFKLDVSAESLLSCSAEIFAIEIAKADPVHGLTTPTFATALTATPLSNLSPGPQPFTYNSNAVEYQSISMSVSHGTKEPQAGGNGNILGLVQMTKECSLDVTVFPDGNFTDAMLDDLDNGTPRTAELVISGTHKIQAVDLQWESMEESISQTSGDVKMYNFKGMPINLIVTTV